MSRRLRVAVLFGGRSSEHEVSLASAANVMAAIPPDRYEVVPVGIDKAGRWLASPEAHQLLTAGRTLSGSDPNRALAGIDVVFPVLHGPYGEDGSLQGCLEMADLPYVGSGVAASALAMDKIQAKRVLREQGFRTAVEVSFRGAEWSPHWAERVSEVCGYPCFVKPANLGSSVGVSKVK
ncbi:MAG: D-alanine--D-alanine ligase, partial [Chloroflexota bacterium]